MVTSLSNHPEILRLQQMRDSLALEARALYGSMKKASGTKIGELKAKAEAALRATKKKLKEAAFNGARSEFFATIDTLEINKQLDPSLMDMNHDMYEPDKIVHHLKERREVAELMQLPHQDLPEREDMMRRVTLINALIELGRVQSVPSENDKREKKMQNAGSDEHTPLEERFRPEPDPSPTSEPRDAPISLTNRHCLFCVFEPNYQCYFATPRKAREHFERRLRGLKQDEPVPCPDSFCKLALRGPQALKSHAQRVHKVRYFSEAQCSKLGRPFVL
ncbi:hypothetical protein N7532_002767 [Penicillium argentinense]|uniref:Uncharacterized protein n=1 Tax=Penicillium argentinense TaxID=1131581 RepID=A0A9W9G2K6_9EURO|nr:uncharacterized protein N7532_002767 [Penicillium argentinense]KAJ5110122.1 hypothetical protein N7532_002767 [Penicillium argentinense]